MSSQSSGPTSAALLALLGPGDGYITLPETAVYVYQSTWRDIPEDLNHHYRCFTNLTSEGLCVNATLILASELKMYIGV